MACDPQTLVNSAQCFDGLSEGALWNIIVYEAAVAAGLSTDPNVLMSLAACFISTGTDPMSLALAAICPAT